MKSKIAIVPVISFCVIVILGSFYYCNGAVQKQDTLQPNLQQPEQQIEQELGTEPIGIYTHTYNFKIGDIVEVNGIDEPVKISGIECITQGTSYDYTGISSYKEPSCAIDDYYFNEDDIVSAVNINHK